MLKVYEFIANGSEDIEALTVVDVLKRAGIDIKTVSINDTEAVELAHGTKMACDLAIADADFGDADMLLLPGGLPGAYNLNEHSVVREVLTKHAAAGKKVQLEEKCGTDAADPLPQRRRKRNGQEQA
jgi:4-methyl-5(b-hydroxyethyl)-thiazole monophosphate biosynthesis